MLIKIGYFIILFFIWLGLAGIPKENLSIFFSILSPLFALIIANRLGVLPKNNIINLSAIGYIVWIIKEVILSSIAVSKIALRKNIVLNEVIKPITTIQDKDFGIVIYANSITLTPGTITLSVDKNHLLIHALDVQFMQDLEEGEMDNRVKKIIR